VQRLDCCCASPLERVPHRLQNPMSYASGSVLLPWRHGVPKWSGETSGGMGDGLLVTGTSGNNSRWTIGRSATPKVKPTHSPLHQLREHTTIPTKRRFGFPSLQQEQTILAPRNYLQFRQQNWSSYNGTQNQLHPYCLPSSGIQRRVQDGGDTFLRNVASHTTVQLCIPEDHNIPNY
jgi:hypothetical protein